MIKKYSIPNLYFISVILLPSLSPLFFVYYLILHSVPDYVFAQAFPYNKGNLGVVDNFTIWDTAQSFLQENSLSIYT